MKVLVTGAAGFISGYLVQELLDHGHEVVGIDNFSKYGPVAKSYDDHPKYRLVEGDAKDTELLTKLAADVDQVVAGAAMIGGISYFHEFAYDLIAENERILASTFDAAIAAHRAGSLERIVVLSSSMVYESATVFPTPEGAQLTSPPPVSTYGFQKLASESKGVCARLAQQVHQHRAPGAVSRNRDAHELFDDMGYAGEATQPAVSADEDERLRMRRLLAYWGDRERADTTALGNGDLAFASAQPDAVAYGAELWILREAALEGAGTATLEALIAALEGSYLKNGDLGGGVGVQELEHGSPQRRLNGVHGGAARRRAWCPVGRGSAVGDRDVMPGPC